MKVYKLILGLLMFTASAGSVFAQKEKLLK